MSAENTVKLLWDCANELTPDTHAKKLLKSYYLNNCRKIAKNHLQMPSEKFAVSQMCPRCSCLWSESEFRLKLKPQQVANSAKARKLIAKLEESKVSMKKGLLTKKQRRRAKWLQKRVHSNVQIKCEYCKEKTLVPLEKPEKKKQLPKMTEIKETEQLVVKPKKKKKKHKDNNAGLKIIKRNDKKESRDTKHSENAVYLQEKCSQIIPTKFNSSETSPKIDESVAKTQKKGLKNVAPLKQPTNASIKTLNHAALKVKTPRSCFTSAETKTKNPNLSHTLKSKKKQKKMSALLPPPVAPKIQSKTQQKHSLLQLAALLKTQGTKSAKNTAQNRLKTLLE